MLSVSAASESPNSLVLINRRAGGCVREWASSASYAIVFSSGFSERAQGITMQAACAIARIQYRLHRPNARA